MTTGNGSELRGGGAYPIDFLTSQDPNLTGSQLVEMGLCIVTEVFCVILIITFLRSYPFHVHLWMLMMNFVVIVMTYTFLRFLLILTSFYYQENNLMVVRWMYLLRYVAVFNEPANLLLIDLERVIAAKFAKKYEKSKHYWVPALSMLASWLLMAALVACTLFYPYLPFFALISFVLVLCLASIIIMIVLYMRIRRQKNQRRIESNNMLSRRYQIKENLKSSKFLLPLISYVTLSSCGIMLLLAATFYLSWSLRIFEFAFSVRSFVVPIIAAKSLQGHCAFRNQLIQLFMSVSNMASSSDEVIHSRVRSGQVFAIEMTPAAELHFQRLHALWETGDMETIRKPPARPQRSGGRRSKRPHTSPKILYSGKNVEVRIMEVAARPRTEQNQNAGEEGTAIPASNSQSARSAGESQTIPSTSEAPAPSQTDEDQAGDSAHAQPLGPSTHTEEPEADPP